MKHFTNKWVLYGLEPITAFWIIIISETLTFDLSNKFSKVETFLTLPCSEILGCYLIDQEEAADVFRQVRYFWGKAWKVASLFVSVTIWILSDLLRLSEEEVLHQTPDTRQELWLPPWLFSVCSPEQSRQQGKLQFWLKSKNCTLCRWPWELCTWNLRVGPCNHWDVLDVGMEQLQLQPDLTFSFGISPLVILGALNYPGRKISLTSRDGCGCEQILLAFPLLCLVARQVWVILSCAAFVVRENWHWEIVAGGSMSCIIWENTGVSCSGRATNGQRNIRFSIRSFRVWFFFLLYQFCNSINIIK